MKFIFFTFIEFFRTPLITNPCQRVETTNPSFSLDLNEGIVGDFVSNHNYAPSFGLSESASLSFSAEYVDERVAVFEPDA
jgi:hypothetical protein